MRVKTAGLIKRVRDHLKASDTYLTAEQLAKTFKVSKGTIYRVVRIMRNENIGVQPAKTGYVMSEAATKSDDVFFLRRVMGRRASDYVALQAASRDIQKRWTSITEQKQLRLIMQPLTAGVASIQQSLNVFKKVTLKD